MARNENGKQMPLTTETSADSSERRFRALIEYSSDIIVLVNVRGQVIYISSSITAILGYESEEWMHNPVLALVHPGDVSQVQQAFDDLLQTPGQSRRVDCRLRCKDGGYRWFEATSTNLLANPDVGALVNTFHDITARKQSANAERNQERFELVQQAAHIGTFEWIIPSDTISWATEAEALYGLPLGSFGGHFAAWEATLHPEDRERTVAEVRQVAAEGGDLDTVFRVCWPDGSVHWLRALARVFSDEQGQPYRMVGVNLDITENKAQEQREDNFINMASHELKTPITSLIGYTHLLRSRLKEHPDPQVHLFLDRKEAQLNKLTLLVSELLDMSKIQMGQLPYQTKRVDLDELLREIVEDIQASTTTHQIILQDNASVYVRGDRERLGHVLFNLISNAVKYSPRANRVLAWISHDEEQVLISVQDFGIGIAEADRERIFERFYQAPDPLEQTYPGLGISLYLSRTIIQRHQGRLWVESRKGKGSTFWVSLPLESRE
jgi:PAS domain S-box-containing protein